MTHANLPNRMENWNVTGIFALDVFLSHLPASPTPLFQPAFLLFFISAFCGRSYFAHRVPLSDHLCTCLFLYNSTVSHPPAASLSSFPTTLPISPSSSFFFFYIIIIITSWGDAPHLLLLKIVPVNFRSATSLFCSMIRYA